MNKILTKVLFCFMAAMTWMPALSQNIYMIGDSHVGSKLYPKKIEEVIAKKYPDIKFGYTWKNGLRFSTYSTTSDIVRAVKNFKPDILIVNLGTNEAYTDRFSATKLQKGIEAFYTAVKAKFPDIKIVFITPYTNKLKLKDSVKVNETNRAAADEIVKFVKSHPEDTYVVDVNKIVGTKYIDSPKLIRDGVHLTVEGYKDLGQIVGQSMLELDGLF